MTEKRGLLGDETVYDSIQRKYGVKHESRLRAETQMLNWMETARAVLREHEEYLPQEERAGVKTDNVVALAAVMYAAHANREV